MSERRTARIAGWAIAVAGLAWVFHDVDPAVVVRGFRGLSWPLVLAAVAADVLAYACQAWRWSVLLRPHGRLGIPAAAQAVYAGLFASEVLPLRAGELVRTYLVARRLEIDLLSVLGSVAVERLFDGVWLALAVGAVAVLVPLPPDLLRAADLLGVVVLAATALFVFVVWRRPPPQGPRPGRLARLGQAVRGVSGRRGAAAAFAISAGVLAFQALALWLMLEAYGIRISPWAGAAVLLIVVLGTALPNTPGNVGSYQLFVVLGLALFGVDKPTAAGFSVVAFVLLTAPLWALGAWAVSASGESLFRLRDEVTAALRSARERRHVGRSPGG